MQHASSRSFLYDSYNKWSKFETEEQLLAAFQQKVLEVGDEE
jgi:hypothetical protein